MLRLNTYLRNTRPSFVVMPSEQRRHLQVFVLFFPVEENT